MAGRALLPKDWSYGLLAADGAGGMAWLLSRRCRYVHVPAMSICTGAILGGGGAGAAASAAAARTVTGGSAWPLLAVCVRGRAGCWVRRRKRGRSRRMGCQIIISLAPVVAGRMPRNVGPRRAANQRPPDAAARDASYSRDASAYGLHAGTPVRALVRGGPA